MIQACLQEFSNENVNQYLDRTYNIVRGHANPHDLHKTLIHICALHVMRMCKRNIKKYHNKNQDEHSQTHYAMRIMGRLINSLTLEEAARIIHKVAVVMRTIYASDNVKKSLNWLENSINTFDEPDDIDDDVTNDEDDITADCDKGHYNNRKTEMHKYWDSKLKKPSLIILLH